MNYNALSLLDDLLFYALCFSYGFLIGYRLTENKPILVGDKKEPVMKRYVWVERKDTDEKKNTNEKK